MRDAIVDTVECFFLSEDQWVTKDNFVIGYCTMNDVFIDKKVCQRITKGILWLIFNNKVIVTRNHVKYLRAKNNISTVV